MAYKNKLIQNRKTGQDIRFLQTAMETNGGLLEMETTYHAASKEPPLHYHPYQQEAFTVMAGEISIRLNGQIKILKAGESLHLPENTVHSMWSHSGAKAVVNWKVRPALNTEHFLETVMGLAADGRTNAWGKPSLLQAALMANKFVKVFRLARPPFLVQRLVFYVLAPFACLKGYRSTYKKYLD
jgi:mannose-6-phosphate isomerase-like protein (cupin superfamily)